MKKLIAILAFVCPLVGLAQQTFTDPLRIHAVRSGNDTVLLTLSNTNSGVSAPFIRCLTTNTEFAVNLDGSIITSAATNHITFGATNTAPVSTNIVTWISVKVSGDTNQYRIGLSK